MSTTSDAEDPDGDPLTKSTTPDTEDSDGNPLTDDQRRAHITAAIRQDAIYDAAVDTFLYQLNIKSSADYRRKLRPDNEDGRAKLASAKAEMKNNISIKLKQYGLAESRVNISHRIAQRYSLLRQRITPPSDEFLDNAVQVLDHVHPPSYKELTDSSKLPRTAITSLRGTLEVDLLQQLGKAIGVENPTFACGGTVPIRKDQTLERSSNTIAPVTIRWSLLPSQGRLVQFPVASQLPQDNYDTFQQLLLDCQPATFGRGGEDILDESYRQATKLDASRFCTDFNPYECGIIDSIAQVLLPEYAIPPRNDGQTGQIGQEHLGISGELYKLNIYSGPGGKFRPHVDTPRDATQFASLVVCLPSPHDGGALVIRHSDRELRFDWSHTDSSAVMWAAFYSDCEHEVEEVQSGHRVTLTYNLYITERAGWRLHQPSPRVEPSQTIIYGMLADLVQQPGFLPNGGVLGLFCRHRYAHNNDSARDRLPRYLKGVDGLYYAAGHALGLRVKVAPIMRVHGSYGGTFVGDLHGNKKAGRTSIRLRNFGGRSKNDLRLEYEGEISYNNGMDNEHVCRVHRQLGYGSDFESRLDQLQNSRRIKNLRDHSIKGGAVTVGTDFVETAFLNEGAEDYGSDQVIPYPTH
ncbi:MAG: hypothetical protein Q9163_002925 [Psora crenata]